MISVTSIPDIRPCVKLIIFISNYYITLNYSILHVLTAVICYRYYIRNLLQEYL